MTRSDSVRVRAWTELTRGSFICQSNLFRSDSAESKVMAFEDLEVAGCAKDN